MEKSNHRKARYVAGMNDFEYCASLSIRHPRIDPVEITRSLGMAPEVTHRVGDQRRMPNGRLLSGSYDSTYWTAELVTRGGEDIPTFVAKLSKTLRPSRDFLRQIHDEGGATECFMGIFAKGLCDQLFSAELLADLGELRLGLRLDYYR
jgi:hypothetical protein